MRCRVLGPQHLLDAFLGKDCPTHVADGSTEEELPCMTSGALQTEVTGPTLGTGPRQLARLGNSPHSFCRAGADPAGRKEPGLHGSRYLGLIP